jgi:hypothetical protein
MTYLVRQAAMIFEDRPNEFVYFSTDRALSERTGRFSSKGATLDFLWRRP